MDKGIEIIIVCAVLAAAVVGVGIFLTVHFCRQRRRRRQHSPSRGGYRPPSGARNEHQRSRSGRQAAGRTRSPRSPHGGTERPLPSPPAQLQPARNAHRQEDLKRWLFQVGRGRELVDVHQPAMSLIAASEVSNAAATLNYSQHTYQTVPDDSMRFRAEEPALEVDACEPPQSPPPPVPQTETRQQVKERQLRLTQKLFPGVPVKEEQVYELRAIFSVPQLHGAAAPGAAAHGTSALPHPSSAPPWAAAAVHHAAPGSAASAGVPGTFSHWPAAARDTAQVSLGGPALTDGGGYGGGSSDTDSKLMYAPSQKTGLTRAQPHGSGGSISGIVFSANVAAESTAAADAKYRHPNPSAQASAPDDECRPPDGSPPSPRYGLPGVGGAPSKDYRTCRAALGQSPPVEPPPLPPRPVSVAVCGLAGGDARARCNADREQRPVGGGAPDLNIEKYLRNLPAEMLEPRWSVNPADGGRAAAGVTVATEEYAGSEQPGKPYCLLGPTSLRTSCHGSVSTQVPRDSPNV